MNMVQEEVPAKLNKVQEPPQYCFRREQGIPVSIESTREAASAEAEAQLHLHTKNVFTQILLVKCFYITYKKFLLAAT